MRLILLLAALILLTSSFVFAHGEDKKGPHGGFIRMPGAFHTELVPEGRNQMRIYLLDIDWLNPMVKSSRVDLKYKLQNQTLGAKCEVADESFLCTFAREINLGRGMLVVESKRNDQAGSEVSYSLPLELESSQKARKPKH